MKKNSSNASHVRNIGLSHRLTYCTLFLFLLLSCGKKAKIDGFNPEKWQEDKLACTNFRKDESQKILKSRKLLQGVSEKNLKDLLGKPDYQVVYKRNVKNLVYYTESGSQCKGVEGPRGARLVFELNALGNVTWIFEEKI